MFRGILGVYVWLSVDPIYPSERESQIKGEKGLQKREGSGEVFCHVIGNCGYHWLRVSQPANWVDRISLFPPRVPRRWMYKSINPNTKSAPK